MRAIRGATTIGSDCAEEIRAAVAELLNEIKARNALSVADILCILLSNTSDIVSFYPAKAAREAGFSSCALYSSAEPEIAGALPLCIRVLVFAEGDGAPKHVYLRGAANLRKDLKKYSVALDGPSGSGKSTVAKLLAKDLHILYLDTGAMYRACALKAIETECPFRQIVFRRLVGQIHDDFTRKSRLIDIPFVQRQILFGRGDDRQNDRFTPRVGIGQIGCTMPRHFHPALCYQILFGVVSRSVIPDI